MIAEQANIPQERENLVLLAYLHFHICGDQYALAIESM